MKFLALINVVLLSAGVDIMTVGLRGIIRITPHPIHCLDPSLVPLLQVLAAPTGWAPGHTGGLSRLTTTIATHTSQVEHVPDSSHKEGVAKNITGLLKTLAC